MPPLVAVCICTRARPQMLRRCLASVRAQRLDAARLRMRLIVVDNNPEPTAQAVVDDLYAGEPCRSYVHCREPGIPIARNAAIEAALRAGADYIAFIDDDEVAPEHWLASLMTALTESGADAVQGAVRRCRLDDEAVDLGGRSAGMAWETCETLATCNVLFKARLVEPPLRLRFDERMQFTGGSDREFFMRAGKHGARMVLVHGAEVLEDVHAERQSLAYQAGRAYAAGSNYFARIAKNERLWVAAVRITVRALDRGLTGIAKLVAGALLLAWRRDRALRQWRKGCASLCFAAGCITPIAGVRSYPYRKIQGA
jgi:glycosyltransferase involved in cell wall biosynthesis